MLYYTVLELGGGGESRAVHVSEVVRTTSTSHSTATVPFIVSGSEGKQRNLGPNYTRNVDVDVHGHYTIFTLTPDFLCELQQYDEARMFRWVNFASPQNQAGAECM